MFVDRLLDVARKYVEAAGEDHVLLAVDQGDETVLVEKTDVAGVEAAATKGFLGRFGLLPVAFHDLRPAKADFAPLADGQHLGAGLDVDHFQNSVRRRQSDAALPGWSVRDLERAERRGFGEAVALARGVAGETLEPLQHFHRQRRAA